MGGQKLDSRSGCAILAVGLKTPGRGGTKGTGKKIDYPEP